MKGIIPRIFVPKFFGMAVKSLLVSCHASNDLQKFKSEARNPKQIQMIKIQNSKQKLKEHQFLY
jgi:hypothetical protein